MTVRLEALCLHFDGNAADVFHSGSLLAEAPHRGHASTPRGKIPHLQLI
jgi:hypothetical protein